MIDSRLRYTSRYDAMKCGMLITVAIHACAPAPMMTRSDLPLSRSGTSTINDSPPTHKKSTTGERIELGLETGPAVIEGSLNGNEKGPASFRPAALSSYTMLISCARCVSRVMCTHERHD